MNTTRIGFFGVVGAVAGFALQGCMTPQPAGECQVMNGAELSGVTNYIGLLEKKNAGATCRDLKTLELGLMRFHDPSTKDFTLAVRASEIVDIAAGSTTLADTDGSNECSDWQNSDCADCVATGDPQQENVCMATDDTNPRTDPKDPKGLKLTGMTPITQFPDKTGICAVTDFTVAQDFQAEDLTLVDGGTAHFDELKVGMEWTNFKLYNTGKVPGTFFTADLKYTEGGCTANYGVKAFWPIVGCGSDEDCNPVANLDAGRPTGSGINPDFKPVCDKDLGICKPSVDVTTLK